MFLVGLLLIVFAVNAYAEKFILWEEGSDITVKVPFTKGTDKKIRFVEPVSFGVPTDFKRYYRTQIVGSMVYLTPLVSTDKKHRVFAKGIKTGRIFILVIENSTDLSDSEDLVVNIAKPAQRKSRRLGRYGSKQLSEVQLVRYASQKLYAPKYAMETIKGVKLEQLSLPDRMDWLYEGSGLDIKPIVAYSSGDLNVTAFEIKNKNPYQKISINLMNIFSRVDAVGASVQHETLGVTASDNSSALYIVTEGSLVNKLKVRGQ
jgi:hypothetical protein